ncbi:hypothetical protein [Haloplanus salilacus]|uniref:hypothetical protein n=1 Tax=Haloplanus salilacus TaxID=2949994 RepID=UPI0030CAFA3F
MDVNEREDRIRRLMEATGENTKAGAIDAAAKHYLADLRNKQQVADDLDTETASELSTPWLPIERETIVGVEEED